ncbi:MAG: sugar phosphate isomerase/epimerase family protein [Bacteroidia bacterium]
MNRRSFINNSLLSMGSIAALGFEGLAAPSFVADEQFELTVLATNWGFKGDFDAFCAAAKADGFDGIEVWLPGIGARRDSLFAALKKYDLSFGLLAGVGENDFKTHFDRFQRALNTAVEQKPLYVNCHSGRDFFSFSENAQIIRYANELSKSSGVPIYHETHRGRILFAAHICRQFLEEIPELRLTLDISHWTNVHESLLENQQETVSLALGRTDHIHARIGHQEGPQVTDPRAPEWENAVKAHFAWWDEIVALKSKAKQNLTVLTEFGPPNYLPTVPYTQQPLADQWGINVHMMHAFRERYLG